MSDQHYRGYVFYNTLAPEVYDLFDGCKYIWLDHTGQEGLLIEQVVQHSSFPCTFVRVEDRLAGQLDPFSFHNTDYQTFSLTSSPRLAPSPKIAFLIASDTIANLMFPVIRKISAQGQVTVFTPPITREKSEQALDRLGIPHQKYSDRVLLDLRPDTLVLGLDWSGEARYIIHRCRQAGIRTVCLQESVIDLADRDERRMQWADLAFVLGVNVVNQLDRRHYFITGNPRYEHLQRESASTRSYKAFVNCNFTYGIEEKNREKWLLGVVEVLEDSGINYVISQHPRDKGDLGGFRNVQRSNAAVVHDQMKTCMFIISRFSSVLHEALFMGKPAIYHNPHGESIGYDYHFDNQVLFYSENTDDLRTFVDRITSPLANDAVKTERYLLLNCNLTSRNPSTIITELLLNLGSAPENGRKIGGLAARYWYFKQYIGYRIVYQLLRRV